MRLQHSNSFCYPPCAQSFPERKPNQAVNVHISQVRHFAAMQYGLIEFQGMQVSKCRGSDDLQLFLIAVSESGQ